MINKESRLASPLSYCTGNAIPRGPPSEPQRRGEAVACAGGVGSELGTRRVRIRPVTRCRTREETVLLLAYHLKELKLGKILRQYPSVACRENRLKRQFRDARFPLVRTLEQFHCDSTPEPDKRVIRELAEGQSIREHRHVIFVGKTETGKTHMTICLGIEACRQGIRSRFVTGSELIGELGCVSFSKEDFPPCPRFWRTATKGSPSSH